MKNKKQWAEAPLRQMIRRIFAWMLVWICRAHEGFYSFDSYDKPDLEWKRKYGYLSLTKKQR